MPRKGQRARDDHPWRQRAADAAAAASSRKTGDALRAYVKSTGKPDNAGFLCPGCGSPTCIGGTECGLGSSF